MVQYWNKLMEVPEARWIVAVTLLVFVVLVGTYVSFLFRNLAIGGSDDEATDILSDFRRMRDEGHLDDGEFNKLKTKIPAGDSNTVPTFKEKSPFSDDGADVKADVEPKSYLTLAEAEARKSKKQALNSGGNESVEELDG